MVANGVSMMVVAAVLGTAAPALWANGPMGTPTSGGGGATSNRTGGTRTGGTRAGGGMAPGRTSRGDNPPGNGTIRVCYDYAYCRGTNSWPAGGVGPDDLRHHKSVTGRTVYTDPNPSKVRLNPGDWVLMNGQHAGYVNASGGIDHFLQSIAPGHRTGDPYHDLNNLPTWQPMQGGFSRNDSLNGFIRSGTRVPPHVTIEVLHRR